jgi:ABC-type tungstate transport system substrate-binding protein
VTALIGLILLAPLIAFGSLIVAGLAWVSWGLMVGSRFICTPFVIAFWVWLIKLVL